MQTRRAKAYSSSGSVVYS